MLHCFSDGGGYSFSGSWILVFRLVDTLGKYAFRIQKVCLFVDCSIENGINSIYWRNGE